MIHLVKPFLSSVDISKGDRWSDVLTEELKDAEYGIVCVTPYNIDKPWMNFEAGVLSKVFARPHLTPFLFRIDRSSLSGPLAQFQSTIYSEDDVLNLIYSINYLLGEAQLDHEVLRRNFDVWWKELKKTLDGIPVTTQNETRTPYSWLYSMEDLAIHEEAMATESIWIITPDIFKYAISDGVRQLVIKNMQRGVQYRYFVPDYAGANKNEKDELKRMADLSQGKLQCGVFERTVFERQATTDYIIINPDTNRTDETSYPRRMFLRLPIEGGDEFWIQVDERSTVNFSDRFRELWSGLTPL